MASREYGGRQTRERGRLNIARLDARELAGPYAELAIKTLVSVCRTGDTSASRVSAANGLLDRIFGKAPQAVKLSNDPDNPLTGAPADVFSILNQLTEALSGSGGADSVEPGADGAAEVAKKRTKKSAAAKR